MKCTYCDRFYRSKPLPRTSDKGEKFDGARLCTTENKMIKSEDEACEYYQPTEGFYCDKWDMRVSPLQCLSRRLNRLGLEGFQDCRKCKQFENNIRQIIEEYYIKCKVVKKLPQQEIKIIEPEAKLKRRKRRKIAVKPKTTKLHRRIKKA